MSLCHEPPNDPFEKAQKEPHGSLEVKCSSSEHDIYRVSEKLLVEVPSQTMVALAVPDYKPSFETARVSLPSCTANPSSSVHLGSSQKPLRIVPGLGLLPGFPF